MINNKQDNAERVGLNLYYEGSVEGLTLLAEDTKEIIIGLNINRTVEQNNESLTDIGWYFDNIIFKLKERKCPIEYIKFEEYEG